MNLTAQKAAARANLKTDTQSMALFCGLVMLGPAYLPEPSDDDDGPTFTAEVVLAICQGAIAMVLADVKTANDPPDPKFMEVTLPSPSLVRSIALRCSKRIARRNCNAVRSTLLRYRNALATTAAAATGAAITLERYSGAGEAGSAPGAVLQAAAEKGYMGELASALTAQQAAGRTLAAALRKARLDLRPDNARAQQSLVKKLGSASGIPQSIVSRLVADGATSSAAELSQTLKSALQGLPKTPALSSVLGAGRSTAALTELYRTLTLQELAALVRGLTSQGAVSSAAGEMLINDLRQAATALTPEARSPAVGQFVKDAGSQVTGPAARLLTVAGGALTG